MRAQKEIATRELCRRKLKPFIPYNFNKYVASWHHDVITDKLEKVESGGINRIMLFLPPRHGKSEIGSIQFPAWYLGRNPDKEIICCSYTSDLAIDFGRKTRNLIDSIEYQKIFDVRLAPDSKASNKWRTNKGGSYTAVGVGGPITGRGADILIIDDPFKNRKEAESPLIRQQIWDWYLSTAYTRLSPGGAVIVIQCMTGDTKVAMANAPEKDLRDIRAGDKIVTYDNGKLSRSIVKNHTSQGSDYVFTIRMSSGKIVRGNERHPFLIYHNGKLQWIRIKNLTTGQKIVTLKDNGVSGKVKNVSTKDVKNQQDLKDTACHTIIKKRGPMATVLRLLTKNRVVMHISNIVTGLALRILTRFWRSKVASVLFANYHLETMFVPIGVENSVSTISTVQKKSEDSSVMTVILQWVMQKLMGLPLVWQSISSFTLDEIISIEEGEKEEVFDIEVDRTANFIANGVVSSNTRWHENDLSGRLVEKAKIDGDKWDVVKFPAIAIQDEMIDGKFARKTGDALWPSRFSIDKLMQIKAVLGNYDWASLYQQEPIDEDSIEFKRDWFKYRSEEDVQKLNTRRWLSVDTAGRMTTKSDYMGFTDNRVDREGQWNIRSWKVKMNSAELLETLFVLQDTHHYEKIGIEKTIYLDAIQKFMEIEMQKRGKVLPIFELKHNNVSKELRIRGLVPRYQAGNIFHITGQNEELEKQLLRFPKGSEDDIIDSLAYQDQIAEAPFFQNNSELSGTNENYDKFAVLGDF